jgi:hypothetical protein
MSGSNIVADTSLIINFFNGINGVKNLIEGRSLFISLITEIEILSFPDLSDSDKIKIKEFLS